MPFLLDTSLFFRAENLCRSTLNFPGWSTQRTERLGQILTSCLADCGNVFIPAFALGRTQELIYEMDRLDIAAKENVPVYIDSPLGLYPSQSSSADRIFCSC